MQEFAHFVQTLNDCQAGIRQGDPDALAALSLAASALGAYPLTPLEYVVERFSWDDALVCAALPALVPLASADTRARALRSCVEKGLIMTFTRLIQWYHVPIPPDALLLAIQGDGWYDSLRRLLALRASQRGADVRFGDADGDTLLHLLCDDALDLDAQLVATLLRAGADPWQRNAAGELPVQRLIAPARGDVPAPLAQFPRAENCAGARAVQRLLLGAPRPS